MSCKNTLGKLYCNLISLKLKTAREIFFHGGLFFSPLVLPRDTYFCRTVLHPSHFTYHMQKIHWNVLYFAEPPSSEERTTDEGSGDRAFPPCFSLLAFCVLLTRRLTKWFPCSPLPLFLVAPFTVLSREGGVLKYLYFRALPWKCFWHSCIPPQGDVNYLWIRRNELCLTV